MRISKAIFPIILLAAVLRLTAFGHNPPGVYLDEAAQGYNAYSLLRTGKDEYGKSWPVFLRSFGDYKMPLYAYLTVPSVKIFGLDSFSTRFVSAAFGTLLVGLIAFWLGSVAGVVAAISPVLVFMSRTAAEANLALTLFFLGVALALRFFRHRIFLPLSFLFLALSGYAYHSYRFLSPVTVLYFTLIYRKHRPLIYFSLIIFVASWLPLIRLSFTPGANSRLTGLWSPSGLVRNYLNYFSPGNLFSRPDPDPQRSYPELSVFYWWMSLFLIAGSTVLWHNRKSLGPGAKTLLFILFAAPLPAAVTREYFATYRVLPMFVCIIWIMSLGMRYLIAKRYLLYLGLLFAGLFDLYSASVLLQYDRARAWNSEYRDLSTFLRDFDQETVLVDNSRLGPAYILFAFYRRADPSLLQSQSSEGFLQNYYSRPEPDPVKNLANTQFRPVDWQTDIYRKQIISADIMAVSPQQAREHFLYKLGEITDFDGKPVLVIYRTDPASKCRSLAVPAPPCSALGDY